MAVSCEFKQSSLLETSQMVASLDDFEEKYSVDIDQKGEISVTERVNDLVLAKYMTKQSEEQCWDCENPTIFMRENIILF
ncbi:MAG: hypothetical protein Tsb0015_10820 [Simkaniaceae bacterium]